MSVLEVEVLGSGAAPADPGAGEVAALCRRALAAAGLQDGHVAVTFVAETPMRTLNRDHRGLDRPTDVLSFPVDGVAPAAGPREIGDIVICPPHATDVREAVVHGALHLAGMDHEADAGEMLALQAQVLRAAGAASRP